MAKCQKSISVFLVKGSYLPQKGLSVLTLCRSDIAAIATPFSIGYLYFFSVLCDVLSLKLTFRRLMTVNRFSYKFIAKNL